MQSSLEGLPSNTTYYTVLHVGCANAISETVPQQIVDKIYTHFMGREVRRVGTTTAMSYWGNACYSTTSMPSNDCFIHRGLLETGDGRCGAWSDFFVSILKTQGIDNAQVKSIYVNTGVPWRNIVMVINDAEYTRMLHDAQRINLPGFYDSQSQIHRAVFFVKRWFVTANTFAKVALPLISETATYTENPLTDQWGAAAQGNPNPMPLFSDHAVVMYNNKIYDPSYGTTICNNLEEWQGLSIDGFGSATFFERVNDVPIWYFWFRSRTNSAQLELRIR